MLPDNRLLFDGSEKSLQPKCAVRFTSMENTIIHSGYANRLLFIGLDSFSKKKKRKFFTRNQTAKGLSQVDLMRCFALW